MKAFDRDADSTTGDWWRVLIDANAPNYTPLTLGPGQSGTITVTFTPQGTKGDKVKGVLYVDDFSQRTLAGNEQMAFPYRLQDQVGGRSRPRGSSGSRAGDLLKECG